MFFIGFTKYYFFQFVCRCCHFWFVVGAGDVGNNDEYSVDIQESYFTNNDIIQFYCEGFDTSDNSYSYGTGQNGEGPFNSDNLGIYYIGSPTSQDVVVTFMVNMSLEATIYDVFVSLIKSC